MKLLFSALLAISLIVIVPLSFAQIDEAAYIDKTEYVDKVAYVDKAVINFTKSNVSIIPSSSTLVVSDLTELLLKFKLNNPQIFDDTQPTILSPVKLCFVNNCAIVLDSDMDGVSDAMDQCIDDAEVYNGYQDWDGCPDVVDEFTILD